MDVKLKRRLNVRHAADEMSRGAHMGCRGQKTGTHWLTARSREKQGLGPRRAWSAYVGVLCVSRMTVCLYEMEALRFCVL